MQSSSTLSVGFPTATQSVIHSILCDQVCPVIGQAMGPCGQTCLFVHYSSQEVDNYAYKIPQLTISRDGHFLLDNMRSNHPVSALLKRMTRSVQTMAGDGTKGAICMAGALIGEAFDMMRNDAIHPKTIARIYQQLTKQSIEKMKKEHTVHILKTEQVSLDSFVDIDKEYLISLAESVLRTRIEESLISNFAAVCVTAIQRLYEKKTVKQMKMEQESILSTNTSSKAIDIICRYDVETFVQHFDGIVIDQGVRDIDMPRLLTDSLVVFISEPLELAQRSNTQHLNMQFHTAQQRVELVNAERSMINNRINAIIDSGAKVVISIDAIDATSLNIFAQHGVIALRHVRKETAHKLAACCGVKFIHNILKQLTLGQKDQFLAKIGCVEVQEDQSSAYTYFSGLPQSVSTIELFAPTTYTVETLRKVLRNTLKVLQNAFEDCQIIPGGGCVDMSIASYIRSIASTDSFPDPISKKIVHSFANAIENAVPGNLCRNSSFNVCTTLAEWRQKIEDESYLTTIDLYQFPIQFHNPQTIGLYDSLRVKIQSYHQCADIVSALLDIDYMVLSGDLTPQSIRTTPTSRPESAEKNKKWQYRRYTPKINKEINWSKHDKEVFQKREDKFYSRQERERRKKIEGLENMEAPIKGISSTQKHQSEIDRRKREMGIQGYNVDPFE